MSDKLPDEVLKLLGDDATPEKAAGFFESVTVDQNSERFDFRSAHTLYRCQIAAAAIRLAEADHAHNVACAGDGSRVGITQDALNEAQYAYRALRNWNMSLAAKK